MQQYSKGALALMARGITLHEVATELGVRPQSVSRWLAGKTPARPEFYDVLARLTDVDFAFEVQRLCDVAHETANGFPVPLRIDELYAYVSVNDDGDEGLCAFVADDGSWMPMVAADEARVEQMRPIAQGIVRQGIPVRLLRFSTRSEIEVL